MKRRGLVFLLLSGCALVCHLHTDDVIRYFHAVDTKTTWTEAQRYCRETFTDLATIQDPTNNNEAIQTMQSGKFWIGLSLNDSGWKWSHWDQSDSVQTRFTNWADKEPRFQECVTISGLGEWSAIDCGVEHHVMCYSAEYDKHILVKQLMTWSEGQTYCKTKYTDLSSISSKEENEQISSLLQSTTDPDDDSEDDREDDSEDDSEELAWFGLYRQLWVWSDGSGGSYRQWASDQPKEKEDCVMVDSVDWHSAQCDDTHPFLCYSDVRQSAMRLVKVRLSGGSADLNDLMLQDAILQQLEQKLQDGGIREEVKLRWRRQSDGRIFHREEETAPPVDWEDEDFCDSSTVQIN